MKRLIHVPLSPFGRCVRLVLAEKGVAAELEEAPETPGAAAAFALRMGAAAVYATTGPSAPPFDAPLNPLLLGVEDAPDGAVAGARAICEYLEESEPGRSLTPEGLGARAEMRRLVEWAETRFWRHAVEPRLSERYLKRRHHAGAPDVQRLRAAGHAGRALFRTAAELLEPRRWLVGENLSLADFALAAQISVLDYLGDPPWIEGETGRLVDGVAAARDWYALMKSRPAFRGLLADRLIGLPPSDSYGDLDF
ncbi:MAG: glutathione S-transferase family protein [Pseudomonadota bacterium]